MPADLSRLSLNQATTRYWTLCDAIDGCARAGIPAIGVWRDRLAEAGVAAAARMLRDAGLHCSSLCRGGWFPAATRAERAARIDDNRRAIEEAAALGADVLVLVCGPAPDRDIRAARAMVEEGIAAILPDAIDHGVTLGIEPLHPMFAADRSVITSLGEAVALAERFDSPRVGVVIDAYHVWWDAGVYDLIQRCGRRTVAYHVSDWIVPLPDVLNGRGMMGDGVIELRSLREAVDAAGYRGFIEVEIFNEAIWNMPGDQVVSLMCERYLEHVAPIQDQYPSKKRTPAIKDASP
ncbi:sugar phosphate isomerase/epimerase [Roseiflexus sp.]|uniref:sugar phosphate isomerase/epimerase family protein n=1 Tax=Roseiflexus sp. TaxID=2562120 RepID=UPI0021DCAD19|nr:sugar phosphate isomerase/epimerase family protein [Roseiflexus sp.]GIW01503.1 MAG: 3-dehydroshikimate dehydratase [Roseiflexus sp.]